MSPQSQTASGNPPKIQTIRILGGFSEDEAR
jgi:hypothetical protein